MPRVVVRHDQPIAEALTGQRPDLAVVGTETTEETLDALATADAFVTNPANWTDVYLEHLDEDDWVQATSAGYAAFPIEEFERMGVIFTNAAGNYGVPVADHAFAMLLGLARGIRRCADNQRKRKWHRDIGTELIDLENRALTIVGMGDIGEEVARRGLAFGMEVRGLKRDPAGYDGVLSSEHIHASTEYDELLPDTDVLVLAVPLTDETHHIVDREALQTLPETALVINVARGPVIDEGALVDALESGDVGGAGLDVFETEPLPESSPLWTRDDVVITPHVGGRSQSFVPRFVNLFLDNYDRRQKGDQMRNMIV